MERPCTTKCNECKVLRVESPAHRHCPHRARHVVVGDLHDASGCVFGSQSKRLGDSLRNGGSGQFTVDSHLAAQQVLRQVTQHQPRVGDCRLCSSLPVARRTRACTSAFGANSKSSSGRRARDTSTSSADGSNVQHRELKRQSAYASFNSYIWPTIPD